MVYKSYGSAILVESLRDEHPEERKRLGSFESAVGVGVVAAEKAADSLLMC